MPKSQMIDPAKESKPGQVKFHTVPLNDAKVR